MQIKEPQNKRIFNFKLKNKTMKTLTILLFTLLVSASVFWQQQAIKITNQTSKKERSIIKNKRIKIKTLDGEKLSGRFKIENNSIIIDNKQITLTDIAVIKRIPLLISIVTNGLLIYGGAIAIGFGTIIGLFADSSGFLLAILGAVMIVTGILSPNFCKKYKNDSNLSLELITIPN